MRVRDVKEWYLEYLAEEFRKENNNHEEMTASVVANVTKEELYTRDLNLLHIWCEWSSQITCFSRNEMTNALTRKCAIYGTELSRSALLCFANQQNEIYKIPRVTTLAEVPATCRQINVYIFCKWSSLRWWWKYAKHFKI